jgi:hypothetical protein
MRIRFLLYVNYEGLQVPSDKDLKSRGCMLLCPFLGAARAWNGFNNYGETSETCGAAVEERSGVDAIKSQAFRHVTGSGSSGGARAIYCVSGQIATAIYNFSINNI